ncbi:MAG: type II toxin-antitoxin system RelB/DinJ family antitoxin [Rickettsiales bacterium]|jgi:addiction module RelB/DinJ family antitoxin|nr:type II toxin-antitoxin system RelB/DinJ family antitoxin [Rickettsiales bacterium]
MQMNVRVPDTLRHNFDMISEKIGINPAEAIRVFMNKFVEYRGFPFNVLCEEPYEPNYNAETRQALDDSINNRNLTITTWDELDKIWDEAK